MVAGAVALAILVASPRVSAVGRPGPPTDPAWERAVALASANMDWVPGLVVVRVEILDVSGVPEQSQEAWVRVEMGPGGDLVARDVRFVEDGAAVSSNERQSAGDLLRDGQGPVGLPPLELFRGSPFDPGVQQDVSASRTGERRGIDGRHCVAFAFSQRKANGLAKGIAWLDEATGAPVEVHITGSRVTGVVGVQGATIGYGPIEGDAWCTKEVLLEGTVGFAWMRRAFRITVTYADYWSLRPLISSTLWQRSSVESRKTVAAHGRTGSYWGKSTVSCTLT